MCDLSLNEVNVDCGTCHELKISPHFALSEEADTHQRGRTKKQPEGRLAYLLLKTMGTVGRKQNRQVSMSKILGYLLSCDRACA